MMMKRHITLLLLSAALLAGAALPARAQRVAAGTNVADWAQFGTANAEVHYGIARHWSAGVNGRVNAWSFRTGGTDEQRMERELKTRVQSYSAGARWWNWNVFSGWWVGLAGQWQEYDNGGVSAPWLNANEAGDAAGLALSGGYALQLSKHWDLDFGLGLWGGWKRYTVYACPWCGREVEGGEKVFLVPDRVMISLLYIF